MLYLKFVRLHNTNPYLYPTYVHGFSGRPVLMNPRGHSSRGSNKKKEACFKLHKYDVENAKSRLNGENVYGKHGK
jgi:hypothetical protein